MRSPRVALLALTVALCVGNLTFTFWRSTIPLALEGTVQSIEFLTEKNPGIDDVHVLEIDDEEFHIDKALAGQLTANVHISKDAWSSELTVGKGDIARTVNLEPSQDFKGMLFLIPAVLIALLGVMSRSRPSRDDS